MRTEKETGVYRVTEGLKQSLNCADCEEMRGENDFGKLEAIREKRVFQLAKMILSRHDRK